MKSATAETPPADTSSDPADLPLLPGEASSGESPPSPGEAQLPAPTTEGPPAKDPTVTETAPPPETSWVHRRLAQQTARVHQLQEEKAALEARLAAPAQSPVPGVTDPDFNARVKQEAALVAAKNEFDRQCDETYRVGKATFGDSFDVKLKEITRVLDRSDPGQMEIYNQFLSSAIETGEGAKLIHELGGNLDEAVRIMSLPPRKMAIELGKMAAAKQEISVSNAPKPITPIGPRGGAHEQISPDDPDRADELPTKVWMERREKQEAARRAERG